MTRLLHPTCAAMKLAMSERQLGRLVREHAIPFVDLPQGGVRFDPQALAEWITRHSVSEGVSPEVRA